MLVVEQSRASLALLRSGAFVEHFFAEANEEEGTEVRPPGRPDLAAMARTCGDLSVRVLRNAARRLGVVKRRGRVRCEDLAEMGLLSAVHAPRCSADVEVRQGGKVQVALEINEGVTFREIMAQAGKAVTDAVLRKHRGCVNDAMRDFGVSRWLWYRARSS